MNAYIFDIPLSTGISSQDRRYASTIFHVPMPSAKLERQRVIREIVTSRAIASQEELRQLLAEQGWDVTQSTLSRDMHDLRLARLVTPAGVRYTTADTQPRSRDQNALASILPQFFVNMDSMREFIVMRTRTAGAQPIAEAIDADDSPDILGTIAGENTILIICRSEGARNRAMKRLAGMAR